MSPTQSWTRRQFARLTLGAGSVAAGLLSTGRLARAETRVAHGISAFGDLKYPADFSHFDYAVPDAPVGGLFSSRGTGASATFDSLNPFILRGEPAQGIGFTYDTLMTGADDEPDAMYGLLAESIEYPEDRSFARFRLRPEARFADGSPVTAEDIVFTFEALREMGQPTYKVVLRDIAGAEAEDRLTVRFDFAEAAAKRDLPMLAAGLPALSKAFFDTRDFTEPGLEPILASGPYAIEDADPGRQITYRRRDDYWGWELPVNRGRWRFERIRYEYFRDNTAAFEAFKGGAFRFHEEFFSKIWATGYDFPAIRSGAVKREQIPDERPAGTQGWFYNLRRPVFSDVRVREAIAMGFDFEWSNRVLFHGLYTRTDSFFEGGPMQAEGKPSPGELRYLEPLADQLPEGLLDEPAHVPPETDGAGRNRRALRRAVRLLEEAGYTPGPDGVRVGPDGTRLEFEVLSAGAAFERIVTPFLKNLEQIGAKGTFRLVDPAQYQERMKRFDFDMTGRRYAMSLTPGTELRAIFHSEAADAEGSANIMGLQNPAVDALLEKIVRAESREDLTDAVMALDRVLRALHLWVPNWNKSSHTIAYWDIFGRPPEKPPYARGVIDLWWIDREKYAALRDQLRD